jgi:hypothetical protein
VQGSEPSPVDEDLRQAQDRFLVPDGARPPRIEFPRGDGGFLPVIYDPVEELFRVPVRLVDLLFGRWVVREQVLWVLFVTPCRGVPPKNI